MNDHDPDIDPGLDALLRRYQPLSPPPGLRARIADAPSSQRTWPWAAAAAAVLAAVVGLQTLSDRLVQVSAAPESDRAIEDLASIIVGNDNDNGNGDSRRLAELIVADQHVRAELSRQRQGGDAGGGLPE